MRMARAKNANVHHSDDPDPRTTEKIMQGKTSKSGRVPPTASNRKRLVEERNKNVEGRKKIDEQERNKNVEAASENVVNCKCNSTKKLSRQEKAELSCKLEDALCYRNWELAECLVMESNVHVLNEALCMSLESIWFLSTHDELNGLTTLIKKIVLSGAYNFSGAVIRSSFLALYISAWQSETMSLGGTQTFVGQRLHKRLQECNGTGLFKKEAGNKVLKFRDWAMKRIKKHQGSSDPPKIFTLSEVQLQLTAFSTFLDLAENRLTISDFTEAFEAACFSLTLYSCSLYPGWASGTSSAAVRGLLNILVDRGADNFNQGILIASRFGCTEVVRMLLQIARSNSLPLDVDVDLALSVAAYYARFDTMNFLVDEGKATAFITPLLTAIEQGCIPVISWFITRGCSDRELCFALSFAAASNQLETATYLLPKVPLNVLVTFSTEILKTTALRGCGSLDGVAFLLSANFLGSPEATYSVVETLIAEEDEHMPELTSYLKNNWSLASFYEGMRDADDHYVNVTRVFRRGCSRIRLRELPNGMVIAIALMPLYRECLKVKGELLPQRLKGELVRSLNRLGYHEAGVASMKGELMTMLERHFPSFLVTR